MARRKSWREKLNDSRDLPKVEAIEGKLQPRWGAGTVAIPAPRDVDALMRRVPAGKLITTAELRERIARDHGADIGCPLTTGIFSWIAAHAADEAAAEGEAEITPYWRALKSGGEVNPKYPGGPEALRERLEAEGHRVVVRGKRLFVADYEESLAEL